MKRYMTTLGERLSYWSYFVGQNVYYNITFLFLSTYLTCRASTWVRWRWCWLR